MIVCDTGPIVAAAIRQDDDFHACTELFTGLHLAARQILVPATVVAEAGYLLSRLGGPSVEAGFLRSCAEGSFTLVDLTAGDLHRMADLVRTYADFPLGTTDASVIAVEERLGVVEVATLDHRHFRAIRPRHVDSLVLLP
jgi:predicted nucleic acid-binding protein